MRFFQCLIESVYQICGKIAGVAGIEAGMLGIHEEFFGKAGRKGRGTYTAVFADAEIAVIAVARFPDPDWISGNLELRTLMEIFSIFSGSI